MIRLKKQENIRSAQKDLTGKAPARGRLLKLRIYTQWREARDDSHDRMDGNNRKKKTISKPQIKIKKVQFKSKTFVCQLQFGGAMSFLLSTNNARNSGNFFFRKFALPL